MKSQIHKRMLNCSPVGTACALAFPQLLKRHFVEDMFYIIPQKCKRKRRPLGRVLNRFGGGWWRPLLPTLVSRCRDHRPTVFVVKGNDGVRFSAGCARSTASRLRVPPFVKLRPCDPLPAITQILFRQLTARIHRDRPLQGFPIACGRRPACKRVQPRSLTNF